MRAVALLLLPRRLVNLGRDLTPLLNAVAARCRGLQAHHRSTCTVPVRAAAGCRALVSTRAAPLPSRCCRGAEPRTPNRPAALLLCITLAPPAVFPDGAPDDRNVIYGVFSTIFWTITSIVLVK